MNHCWHTLADLTDRCCRCGLVAWVEFHHVRPTGHGPYAPEVQVRTHKVYLRGEGLLGWLFTRKVSVRPCSP